MMNTAASIWYVPANGGEGFSILIKAPTPVLKALVSGCGFKLTFGKYQSLLCIGTIIKDVPDAPFVVSNIQREWDEHDALAHILNSCQAPLFLFDEMDRCVAWTDISFSKQSAQDAFKLIGEVSSLYHGSSPDIADKALDCFGYSQNPMQKHSGAVEIPCAEIVPQMSAWSTAAHYFYHASLSQPLLFNNPNEGSLLESTVWTSLSSVFPDSLFQNPSIVNGQKKREFTDVFAVYPYGSFLIETKSLSVFSSGFQREHSRRITGIQKQARKAIGQLTGACKDFTDGKAIYDFNNNLIEADRSKPPHCIALVSELPPAGNWDGIVDLLRSAMEQTGAFFHLLDLQEFITLLKASSGNAMHFDYHLMQRFKLFWDVKSVFIRSGPYNGDY